MNLNLISLKFFNADKVPPFFHFFHYFKILVTEQRSF